jgi:hypothetical protein
VVGDVREWYRVRGKWVCLGGRDVGREVLGSSVLMGVGETVWLIPKIVVAVYIFVGVIGNRLISLFSLDCVLAVMRLLSFVTSPFN